MKRWTTTIALLGAVLLIGAGTHAAEVDEKSEQVLRKMSDLFKDSKSASAEVSISMKMQGPSIEQQTSSKLSIAIERPNKVALVVNEGMAGATIVSDGQKLYTYMPMINRYMEQAAPETVDAIMKEEIGGLGGLGAATLVLFVSDPYARITEEAEAVSYVGEEEIDGAKHHRVRFKQKDADVDLWITTGEKPTPRRLVPDLTRHFEALAEEMPQMAGVSVEAAVEVTNWKIDEPVAAERFKFEPPAGATKVESIEDMFRIDESDPISLRGEPAPDFELERLEGGSVRLSDHREKNVVVLDFWATWCAPCIVKMPTLQDVAQEYAQKGVVLYSINQREDVQRIRRFLSTRKLELDIVLDRDGRVSDAYKAKILPLTVIIGADGVIKIVHTGMAPNLKQKLSAELDAVLAGQPVIDWTTDGYLGLIPMRRPSGWQ